MSGHSKWSQIKRQKEKTDIKKGLTFTKLTNAIIIAVREGGGITDPNQNFRLRLAADAARVSNMPKENIERAIQRASKKGGGGIEEVIYEGFAPGGVSVIVEAATDNSQRTTAEIKNLFNKEGAIFGQPGSVSYQFSKVGRIVIEKNGKTLDEIFSIAVENGAEEIGEEDDSVIVYTKASDLSKVRNKLMESGFKIVNAGLTRKPTITTEVSDPLQLKKIKNFLETINSLEDVQNVYSNLKELL